MFFLLLTLWFKKIYRPLQAENKKLLKQVETCIYEIF